MKQIWIDYCKQFGISLDTFIALNKSLLPENKAYIEWLEDQNKDMADRIEELENLNEEED